VNPGARAEVRDRDFELRELNSPPSMLRRGTSERGGTGGHHRTTTNPSTSAEL
jgi:hypothetical protein